MQSYLAALNTGGLSNIFGRITALSAATILIIGIVIHYAMLRKNHGLPIRHYGGIIIYGAAAAVVWPSVSAWLTHLSTTSRGWFDILILAIAGSDIIARILARFGGGGG